MTRTARPAPEPVAAGPAAASGAVGPGAGGPGAAGADSVVRFHPLVIRPSENDADAAIVGRPDAGEFVELPAIGAEAIRLLDSGDRVAAVERRIAAGHGVEVDLAELVEDLAAAGFVAELDGRAVPDPHRPARSHLPWLRPAQVSWLFGRWAKVAYAVLVGVTGLTVARQPDLLPTYRDFYWTEFVGLAVLVNTVMYSLAATAHELSHLAAARSLGAPARISFATRLHHLVLQTDVSAVWAVPRAARYRVYLSGIGWDLAVVCASTLLIAYAPLPSLAVRLLAALVVVVLLSVVLQFHVYMRTDLYFVLLDLLRCRNLFHDGLAYARHLLRRARRAVLRGRSAPPADPTAGIPAHERRAVRVYAVAMVVGSVLALAGFAFYGIPILVHGALTALSAVAGAFSGGSLLAALDGAAILAVEGTLQVIFIVTFLRRRQGRRHTGGS